MGVRDPCSQLEFAFLRTRTLLETQRKAFRAFRGLQADIAFNLDKGGVSTTTAWGSETRVLVLITTVCVSATSRWSPETVERVPAMMVCGVTSSRRGATQR